MNHFIRLLNGHIANTANITSIYKMEGENIYRVDYVDGESVIVAKSDYDYFLSIAQDLDKGTADWGARLEKELANAPDGFRWFAMDRNGVWFWYATKPFIFENLWEHEGVKHLRSDCIIVHPNWKESLQEVPCIGVESHSNRWEDAPDWANYVAQNLSGIWMWIESVTHSNTDLIKIETLEARPESETAEDTEVKESDWRQAVNEELQNAPDGMEFLTMDSERCDFDWYWWGGRPKHDNYEEWVSSEGTTSEFEKNETFQAIAPDWKTAVFAVPKKEPELKPCPFCGSDGEFCETPAWHIFCINCAAETSNGIDGTQKQAAKAWNKRS